MRKMLFLSPLIFLAEFAFAQGRKECSNVLIPDQNYMNYEQERAVIVQDILKRYNLETYSDYRNSSFGATVPIGQIVLGGNAEQTESKYREFFNSLYTYRFDDEESKERLNSFTRRLSSEAIKAWSHCMESDGFYVWIEQGADLHNFTLHAKNIDNSSLGTRPKLITVEFNQPVEILKDGAFMNRTGTTNTTEIFGGADRRQQFKRKNNEEITITVDATIGEGLTKTLPKINLEPPSPRDPILPEWNLSDYPGYIVNGSVKNMYQFSLNKPYWQDDIIIHNGIKDIICNKGICMHPKADNDNAPAEAEWSIPKGAKYLYVTLAIGRKDSEPNTQNQYGELVPSKINGRIFFDVNPQVAVFNEIIQGIQSKKKVITVPQDARKVRFVIYSMGTNNSDRAIWASTYFSSYGDRDY